MKQLLLILITAFISVSTYPQNKVSHSSTWNNSISKEKQNSSELNIYPNPCKSNKVTIDFKSHLIEEVQLTSITGKQIFQKKLQIPEATTQIHLEDVENGMYLLKVKSVDNQVVVKKFIVAKE